MDLSRHFSRGGQRGFEGGSAGFEGDQLDLRRGQPYIIYLKSFKPTPLTPVFHTSPIRAKEDT
jgi:hypothetical protein